MIYSHKIPSDRGAVFYIATRGHSVTILSGVFADGGSVSFQLADAGRLPNLKELLQSSRDTDAQAWDLVSWILSSKILTIHSAEKAEVRLECRSQVPKADWL